MRIGRHCNKFCLIGLGLAKRNRDSRVMMWSRLVTCWCTLTEEVFHGNGSMKSKRKCRRKCSVGKWRLRNSKKILPVVSVQKFQSRSFGEIKKNWDAPKRSAHCFHERKNFKIRNSGLETKVYRKSLKVRQVFKKFLENKQGRLELKKFKNRDQILSIKL
jgi:hypothetical protein